LKGALLLCENLSYVKGHFKGCAGIMPACLPACLWFLDTWEVSLEKKPQKEEEKKGGFKQIITLSKALGNSKDAPQDWRKKSLFSCLSCLTCTAHAPALRPSLLLPIT
jgi:hypothetical protein